MNSDPESRAAIYIAAHPEDEPAVIAILTLVEALFVKNGRELAEMVAGREILDSEWSRIGYRWERAWNSVVGGPNIQTDCPAAWYYG